MPFQLIVGTFHVLGASPDGDSVRFKAHDAANWDKLRRRATVSSTGMVQLRFEGVDTLETHYLNAHQPRQYADLATDFTLHRLGIKHVQWGPSRTKVIGADDGTTGYILARDTDGVHGRPVAFVYSGPAPAADGSDFELLPAHIRKSVNCKLVAAGLAYPMYYRTLFYDLRRVLTQAVVKARVGGKGLWPADRSARVTVSNVASITEKSVIYPKLFRRLYTYLQQHGSVAGFKEQLGQGSDRVLILSLGHNTGFDWTIKQSGSKVGMRFKPEDFVFDP